MSRFDTKKSTTTKTADVAEEKPETTTEGTTMGTDVFDDDFETPEAVTESEVDETEADTNEAAPAEAPAEEAEPDISNFVALVESLISRDESGEVIEVEPEQVTTVQNAYKVLSRKEKNLAKNDLQAKMEKAVMSDDDISLAKFYLDISSKMLEAPKVKKEAKDKKPADPTDAWVKLIALLDLARALVTVPDGMDKASIDARAAELFKAGAEDAQKSEPELVWVKRAITLASPKKSVATVKSDGTRARHSVANHIAEAFANAQTGEKLTVGQIVDFKSDEYGDDRPSKQAVVAHLSSKKFVAATTLSVEAGENGEPVLVKK